MAAMAAAEPRVRDCYTEFEASGSATVRLIVDGEGRIESLALLPPFEHTPTGFCIKAAVRTVQLPRFTGEKITITYPFVR
jgi:hypothetical protein